MNLSDLRTAVYEANMQLEQRGLVLYSFGNASGIDRQQGVMVIKPSGVPYAQLTPEMMVAVDISDNRVISGSLRPSSDTATHTALYRAWPDIGGVVHTHSTHATAWCQAGRELPCLGTTHADYCDGAVPCTAMLSPQQAQGAYEHETGEQILAAFAHQDHRSHPMVLVAGHAPFTWGSSPEQAVFHSVVLEELARMACLTLAINPQASPLPEHVRMLHYKRKHGPQARYGQ